MRRGYSYAKDKPKSKLPPLKYIFTILAFIALAVFIYTNFIKSEKTVIAGFNWSDEHVNILTQDRTIEVDNGDMYGTELNRKGDLVLGIKDSQGDTIRENKYLIGNEQTIILELVSGTNKQCIIEADVTDIYYVRNDEPSIGNYSILNEGEATQTYIHHTDHNLLYYVYPGKYSSDLLPEAIPKNVPLLGIFFVDCENLDNEENLNSDILGSIFYETNQ